MKVCLDDYEEDLRVLDLGCGVNKCKNAIGIDIDLDSSADILADLTQKHLPIKDNSVDMVIAKSVLEHISDTLGIFAEVHRILKPGGRFRAYVPNAFGRDAFDDPTHRSFFTLNTINSFCKKRGAYYVKTQFLIGYVRLIVRINPPTNNIFFKKILEIILFPLNFIFWFFSLILPRFFEEFIKLPFFIGELYFELVKK
jgi:SAM-dependent methyltransferase